MMNLTVTQFGVAGMAMMGMKDLLDENIDKKVKLRALRDRFDRVGIVGIALQLHSNFCGDRIGIHRLGGL